MGKASSLVLKIVIVLLLTAIGAVFAVGFVSFGQYQQMKGKVEMDRIYKNIYINDINVGELTKEEAIEKLTNIYKKEFEEKQITVNVDTETLNLKFSEFSPKRDVEEAVEMAYSYARTGFIASRYEKIVSLETNPYKIQTNMNYSCDDSAVYEKLLPIAEKVDIPAVNATITRKSGKFTVTNESKGRKFEVEKTAAKVSELLLADKEGVVEGIFTDVMPQFKAADLEKAQSLIGSYSSTFTLDTNGRNDNIYNASSKINEVVVYPGEVFSTNKAFGAMTYENGYRLAPVIIGGKLVDDMGGGVCQVSSTLYNALLLAELKITERQNHSMKVGYMDYGFDATLAGDYIDLKFQNDTDYPVFIESYIADKRRVVVNIYGYEIHSSTRRLEFRNALVETVQPGAEVVTKTPSLPAGQRKVVSPAKVGYRYEVYKIIYENGVQVGKTLVNKSYYKPVRSEILIGTGGNANASVAGSGVSAEVTSIASADSSQTTESEASTSEQQPVASEPIIVNEQPVSEPVVEQKPTEPTESAESAEPIVTEQPTSIVVNEQPIAQQQDNSESVIIDAPIMFE